nr:diguanylate cyclase [Halomonas sp.]
MAERLQKQVAELPLKEGMSELRLSITIGIAVAHNEEISLESLIHRADQMLYVGKRDGRDRIVMCRTEEEQAPANNQGAQAATQAKL